MKIYLCGRYSRRDQLRDVRDKIQQMGHDVVSRWLDTEYAYRPDQGAAAPPEYREKYARIDLEDVAACDAVISFTEAAGIPNAGRGGRHVEFGYALALGKRLIVIGHRENLFHHHPRVEFFASYWDVLRALEREAAV